MMRKGGWRRRRGGTDHKGTDHKGTYNHIKDFRLYFASIGRSERLATDK